MLLWLPEQIDNATIKIGDDLARECYNLTSSDTSLVHPLVEFIHVCLTAIGRSYVFCPPGDSKFSMRKDGAWHGSMGAIVSGSFDMAVADFSEEHLEAMPYFSLPLYVDQQSALINIQALTFSRTFDYWALTGPTCWASVILWFTLRIVSLRRFRSMTVNLVLTILALHTLELRSLLKSCMALKLIVETREPFQGLYGLLDFVAQNNHTLVVLPWQEVEFKRYFHNNHFTETYGEISMQLADDNANLYQAVAENPNAAAVLGSSFAYLGAQSSRKLAVLVDHSLRDQRYGLFYSRKLDIVQRLKFQFAMGIENGIFSRSQKRVEAAAKLPAYRLPNTGMKSLDVTEHKFAFLMLSSGLLAGMLTVSRELLSVM